MPAVEQRARVVLLNDTSRHNHHGCRRVVTTIHRCLADRGLAIIDTAPAGSQWSEDERFLRSMERADLILINGEGTLHHAAGLGTRLLEVVAHPARGNRPVALINTIYQHNPSQWAEWLGQMSLIATRDRSSQAEIQGLGLQAEYAPDLSLHFGSPGWSPRATDGPIGYGDSVFPDVKRALRQAYLHEARPSLYLPIHTGIRHPAIASDWSVRRRLHNIRFGLRARLRNLRDRGYCVSNEVEGFIGDLRRTSIYLTGRYHGICLALAAGVPFRAVASNSHKIEALLREAGVRPERLAGSAPELARTAPHEWRFSTEEAASLSAFLHEGRQRTETLFDRIAGLALQSR